MPADTTPLWRLYALDSLSALYVVAWIAVGLVGFMLITSGFALNEARFRHDGPDPRPLQWRRWRRTLGCWSVLLVVAVVSPTPPVLARLLGAPGAEPVRSADAR